MAPLPEATRLLDTALSSARAGGRKVAIMFVCTGNICRSPTAEAVLRSFLARDGLCDAVVVASSGTSGHVGWAPDRRSASVAARRGYDMRGQRGRALAVADFETSDVLLALDSGHLEEMRTWRRVDAASRRGKTGLLLAFAPRHGRDVIDPYYEDDACFETVLSQIEEACEAIAAHLRAALKPPASGRGGEAHMQ